ncbi:hypothetical protein B0O99DRAFT_178200, partial [Bisporella sp. PMI_857]
SSKIELNPRSTRSIKSLDCRVRNRQKSSYVLLYSTFKPEAQNMDGVSAAKTVNSEFSDSIHESSRIRVLVGEKKNQGTGTPAFSKDGAIGKQFEVDGAIGSIGQKVGGPFAKGDTIGKNFNADGAIGGTAQQNLGNKHE